MTFSDFEMSVHCPEGSLQSNCLETTQNDGKLYLTEGLYCHIPLEVLFKLI